MPDHVSIFFGDGDAFLSLNRIRMKNMADKGNKRAALVLELEEKYDNLLSTILIGNNIVNILSSSLATILFVKCLGMRRGQCFNDRYDGSGFDLW